MRLSFQSVMEYEEHEKRAWSVDFSRTDPSLLVSGSDDCKVCRVSMDQNFLRLVETALVFFALTQHFIVFISGIISKWSHLD